MNSLPDRRQTAVFLMTTGLLVALWDRTAQAGELIVPVRVSASSNAGQAGPRPKWHVDTLRLGAKHFNPTTGSNAPYGLVGYLRRRGQCVVHSQGDSTVSQPVYPRHEHYQAEPAEHPKPQGMWLSGSGDSANAWIEFELPENTALGQIWIWNWNR